MRSKSIVTECSNCGASQFPTASSCTECGTPLSAPGAVAEATTARRSTPSLLSPMMPQTPPPAPLKLTGVNSALPSFAVLVEEKRNWADRAWRGFRGWPLVGQVLAWFFFAWALIPILFFRSTTPKAVRFGVVGLAGLALFGAALLSGVTTTGSLRVGGQPAAGVVTSPPADSQPGDLPAVDPTVTVVDPAATPPVPEPHPTAVEPPQPPVSVPSPVVGQARPTAPAAQPGPTMTYGPCAATLPAGFVEDAPGSGYYPARNRSGFAAVDAPDTAGGGVALPDAAQVVLNGFQTVVPGYTQTKFEGTGDTLRVEFTGTVDGRPGKGISHFTRFGTIVCGVTLFLLEGSDIAFDPTLTALTESVRVGDPSALPPATPTRPTPASAPRR